MSTNPQAMEHRRGTRVGLDAAGKLRAADGSTLRVTVLEASLSGALVRVQASLPTLSRVRLRVYAASGEWLEACVVRRTRAGVGLEWLETGAQAVRELLALREPGNPPGPHPDAVTWKLRRLQGWQPPVAAGES
jgi:hypothetical protein